MMYARSEDELDVLTVSRKLAALDVGGGVTGFFTNRVGVSWDVRYFRSVGAGGNNGLSFGNEHLSFWRAMMAGVFAWAKSLHEPQAIHLLRQLLLLSTAGVAADESLRIVPWCTKNR